MLRARQATQNLLPSYLLPAPTTHTRYQSKDNSLAAGMTQLSVFGWLAGWFFGLGHNEMAFRNGCCCCFAMPVVWLLLFPCPEPPLRAPLRFWPTALSPQHCVCLLSVASCLLPVAGCLWHVARPRNVSASYTFYKDIKYKIYGMCDCDTVPCIWASVSVVARRPIDTMPSNVLVLLLLFVVDSSAYRSVNN